MKGSLVPPGYMKAQYSVMAQGSLASTTSSRSAESEAAAAKAKAMQIAWSPGKSLFGLFVMMFMIGSQLTVFSVFFLIPVLTGPISQLMNVHSAFSTLEGKTDLAMAKLTYTAMSCVGLAVGLYKVNSMGLLPVTSADWISLLPAAVAPSIEIVTQGLDVLQPI